MTPNRKPAPDAVRDAVKSAMEEMARTQTEVARAAKIPQGALSDWLNGKTSFTCARASRVLHVLGLHVESK